MTYSQAARQTLRNVCRAHDDIVVRRFGRAALFERNAFAAFHALRLREKHGGDVQLEVTRPLNEYDEVPVDVRDAAAAYEARDRASLPYETFAAETGHPSPASLRDREV